MGSRRHAGMRGCTLLAGRQGGDLLAGIPSCTNSKAAMLPHLSVLPNTALDLNPHGGEVGVHRPLRAGEGIRALPPFSTQPSAFKSSQLRAISALPAAVAGFESIAQWSPAPKVCASASPNVCTS